MCTFLVLALFMAVSTPLGVAKTDHGIHGDKQGQVDPAGGVAWPPSTPKATPDNTDAATAIAIGAPAMADTRSALHRSSLCSLLSPKTLGLSHRG